MGRETFMPARLPGRACLPSLSLLLLLIASWTCRDAEALSAPDAPAVSPVRGARVLVGSDLARVRLRGGARLTSLDADGTERSLAAAGSWLVATPAASAGIRIGEELFAGDRLTIWEGAGDPVSLSAVDGDEWLAPRDYPGTLTLVLDEDGRLDVINTVEVEAYVGAVVAGEAWPTFHHAALRAQAIAVRTFVLYQMSRRSDAPFDVSATQRSQVYRGVRDDEIGRRAADAARYTRGIVVTYIDGDRPKLFCAYYSAACGGLSQPAAIFGPENEVPPLAGGVPCDECRIAPGDSYRWGPVRLDKADVLARLAARYPAFAKIGQIERITVETRTDAGRPVTLRITGSQGTSEEILAERFRLALGGAEIRSTDCEITVTRNQVVFSNGRGFGHGLGLCQWGMEGRARKGQLAGEILRYYYPGCRLARVY